MFDIHTPQQVSELYKAAYSNDIFDEPWFKHFQSHLQNVQEVECYSIQNFRYQVFKEITEYTINNLTHQKEPGSHDYIILGK